MNTIYIPDGSGPTDPGKRALLDALVGADLSTLSPREQAVLDSASDHGECYWATITRTLGGRVRATTDLGDYGSTIVLEFPDGYSNRRMLDALDAAAQSLMEVR